jgi:hypothetical protein
MLPAGTGYGAEACSQWWLWCLRAHDHRIRFEPGHACTGDTGREAEEVVCVARIWSNSKKELRDHVTVADPDSEHTARGPRVSILRHFPWGSLHASASSSPRPGPVPSSCRRAVLSVVSLVPVSSVVRWLPHNRPDPARSAPASRLWGRHATPGPRPVTDPQP